MSKKTTEKETFALAKENYILLVIGFVIIVLGFILMIGGKSDDPAIFNEKEIFSFRRIKKWSGFYQSHLDPGFRQL